MRREPKVACIELNCLLKGESKTHSALCEKCKERFIYLEAIERSDCRGLPTVRGNDFTQEFEVGLDVALDSGGYLEERE